jgi:ketosteroid isomerase-like protein
MEVGMNKRNLALGLLAGMATTSLLPVSSHAAAGIAEADARTAILGWLTALASHDPATVARVLAPEFQIMRSDGSGFDAKTYLDNLPKFKGKPEIIDLAVGAGDALIVARYNLKLDQKIGDKPVQSLAPRLSVFRQAGGSWLIAAHANFAQIG